MGELTGLIERRQHAAAGAAAPTLAAEPARRLTIVTCMDARIEPLRLLGFALGDVHVLRNAGGRATDDVVRSLALSTHMLGTRELALIQHTECGLLGTTNEAIRARVVASGCDAAAIDFLPIDDLDAGVRADVAQLRGAAALSRELQVSGFVYDIRSGELRRVTD
jgi:carbonic anhydrase